MIAVQVGARLGDVDAVLRNWDCGSGMISIGFNLPKSSRSDPCKDKFKKVRKIGSTAVLLFYFTEQIPLLW